ncbi:MAG TPA: enoyl-CoA hydratase-related protein [Acidimicrobiales bacterium]|nr:enoyl-CoA hydratase-related protein [Acidimicrobiales bacterium]
MEHVEVGWEARPPLGLIRLPEAGLGRRAALELDEILAGLHEDDSDEIRVLVMSGFPGSAGPEAEDDATRVGVDPPSRLVGSRRPVVAAVTGACRSAPLALALASDVRIASPDARFGLPEVPAGAVPGWDAIALLVRVVGPARATPMVLAGRELDAAEALAAGLVHEVADEPLVRAVEVAEGLAERGPLALEYAKEAIWRGARMALGDALRLEADFNHLLQASEDRAEGLAAFFDKRTPRFQGR